MRFEPFHLEDWLIRCRGARIDLDHSGAPDPRRDGFDPCIGGEAWLDEFEVEEQLYKAICSAYKVKKGRVALTNGAQAANYAFFESCFGRKDKMALESPTYAPIRACADVYLGERLPLPRRREEGYALDQQALERALGGGARAVVLTNLHNPSARMLADDDLGAVLEAASAKGSLVLVDEVFREMCHRRPPKAAFELGDNGISTNGMSKLWGLGGLRVGWLIGPEDVVEKVTETRLYSSWHLPVRSMALAVKAIERRRWFRERVLEAARRKLPLILDWAAGERRASITEPQGCLHLLIHLPEGTDDERFALRLLNRHGVAVCPGRYFGEGGSIRVTYSCGGEDLADGLEAISSTLGPS